MKLAKLEDLKNALEKRTVNQAPRIDALSFADLPGFEDTSLELNATFLAICGGTGVGKSALLELLHKCLAWETSPPASPRLGACKADLRVTLGDKSYDGKANLLENTCEVTGEPPTCFFVGLSDRTTVPQNFFRITDIAVVKEGVDGRAFSDRTISLLSYICRNDYKSILFYEIEMQDGIICPYFEIETKNSQYSSRTMATGELSVFYIAWVLTFSPPWSMILIEEPEAFLPPLSHRTVFGLICQMSVEHHHAFAITTHSAEIASQVREANLISVRLQGGTALVPSTKESKLRVLSRLGLLPAKSAVLFVEDHLAAVILEELLFRFEFAISTKIEIAERQGDGGVHTALKGLPDDLSAYAFLGVLDGDVKAAASEWDVADQLVFLPFDIAMEEEFIRIAEASPERFAKQCGRGLAAVEDAFAAHTGANFHDRFGFLAADLGISYDALCRVFFGLWSKSPGTRSKARKFASDLARKLRVTLPS